MRQVVINVEDPYGATFAAIAARSPLLLESTEVPPVI